MKTTVLVMIVICASGVLAQNKDKSAVTQALAACGADNIEFEVTRPEISTPSAAVVEPDKALVYVIAEEVKACAVECPFTTRVGLDGSWVGANKGNSYFSLAVAPGEHHLCAKWQSKLFMNGKRRVALANFTARAGKVYYFRTRMLESEHSEAFLDLDPISSDQGRLLVASYLLSVWHVKR